MADVVTMHGVPLVDAYGILQRATEMQSVKHVSIVLTYENGYCEVFNDRQTFVELVYAARVLTLEADKLVKETIIE